MKHKTLVGAISILAAGVLVAAWFLSRPPSNRPEPSVPRIVTIGTFSKAYGNLPYYVAKHFRWFENDPSMAGATVKYTEYNDRPAISDALSTGGLQVLFSGDAPALLCRAQGNDIKVVAVSGNAEQEIVVRPDSPVHSVPDLRGKKVAVMQATSSHYALLKILQANGMGEANIAMKLMSPPEARVAFEAGRIDAWAVWAPFVEQEQADDLGRVVVGSDALINSIMSVSGDLLRTHEPIVRAVVNSVDRAKRWMVANPDEAQRIAVEQLGLKPKVVALAWPKFNWAAQLDDALTKDLQAKIDFLASLDKTRQSKTIDVSRDYVDRRFRGVR